MIILVSKISKVIDKLPLGNKKKVAFIPNAKLDESNNEWLKKYKKFFRKKEFRVKVVNLNKFDKESLYKELRKYEIIYVSGGNTFVLLKAMRNSGFNLILDNLLKKGIIYIGESAGAVVMGPSIEPFKIWDNIKETNLDNYQSLGKVDFVFLPHYNDKKSKRIIDKIIEKYKDNFKLRKFTNYEGVIVEGVIVKRI